MRCPFCRHRGNRVVDSRMSADGTMIRRRRMCTSCKRRFTTYERVDQVAPMVVKKDGRREPYDRSKIIAGLKKACEKRPVSMETIEQVADRVEAAVMERGEKEVPSEFIGAAVMKELHEIDQVAYVRFASVYRSFKDIDEFMRELQDLMRSRNHQSGAQRRSDSVEPGAESLKRDTRAREKKPDSID
jgi:transcriptional repressor NrdR